MLYLMLCHLLYTASHFSRLGGLDGLDGCDRLSHDYIPDHAREHEHVHARPRDRDRGRAPEAPAPASHPLVYT